MPPELFAQSPRFVYLSLLERLAWTAIGAVPEQAIGTLHFSRNCAPQQCALRAAARLDGLAALFSMRDSRCTAKRNYSRDTAN